jgi:predicted metal-dependent hydrolase
MSKNNIHTLEYGNTTIEYWLTYAERESLAIHILPDTQVTVEAPLGSDFAEIEKRIRKRAAWIVRQQRNFRRYSFDIPPRQYVSGESYRHLGRQYQLKVLQSEDNQESVTMDREYILVTARDKNDRASVKNLLNKWYRQQCLKVFSEQIEAWCPRFERYAIKRPHVLIRRMRSQWGSCTAAGKMTLNIKLIQVPRQFIDYVIVHELCHLVEHNHSASFYALLSRIMPDWEGQREKLNSFEF